MQRVTRDLLLQKACELLEAGTVNRVYGWQKGEFDYDVTPAVFSSKEELEAGFVWNDFCGANFSKYLIKETAGEGKILVFLKPCDTYSFNQLLTEHRFDREKVYAVGIPCDGMADIRLIEETVGEGITGVESEGDELVVHTLYDG
ncbi:MAG: 4Fe-4S ferredoxin, partial [Clostridia bacterium]|nr:4Fe-4S ferredoxin [Clostridia bacterium]